MPLDLTPWGDLLAFTASNGSSHPQVWTTDGSVIGTVPVTAFASPTFNAARPFNLTAAAGTLFFTHSGLASVGNELWAIDAAETSGARLVKDLLQGPNSSNTNGLFHGNDQHLLFAANINSAGFQLWSSHGLDTDTQPITALTPAQGVAFFDYASLPVQFQGSTYFAGLRSSTHHELWRTDGAAASTQLVDTLGNSGTRMFTRFEPYGGLLYALGTEPSNGQELRVTDGSPNSLNLWADLSTGSGGGVRDIAALPNGLLVSARVLIDESSSQIINDPPPFIDHLRALQGPGSELYITTGTVESTQLVKDINPGSGHSSPQNFMAGDTVAWFLANDGTHGFELWRTDGTADGTFRLTDIAPANFLQTNPGQHTFTINLRPGQAVTTADLLFFTTTSFASNPTVFSQDLWVSDGTVEGTFRILDHPGLLDIEDADQAGSIFDLTVVGDTLYFVAPTGVSSTNRAIGYEIHKIGNLPVPEPASVIAFIALTLITLARRRPSVVSHN